MNTKVIAVSVVAILVVAAIGVIFVMNDDEEDSTITIVDGANNRIVLDAPLEKVAVINKNVPTTMKMFGLDDSIVCYYYGSNTLGINAEVLADAEPDRNLKTYYTPSVETLLKYDVDAVICPVSSMTLYSSVQKSCEQNGIKVIRLDCNGDSLFDDMGKLSKVFGDPESATSKIEAYQNERTAMINAIVESLKGKELYDHLTVFGSRDSIYNESSAMSDLLDYIFDKNVTSYTNLSTDTVTNPVNTNSQEEIAQVEDKIDVLLMRTDHSGKDAIVSVKEESYDKFVGTGGTALVDASSSVYQNARIYSVESDIMSGLYGHIGLLVLVKVIYGVEVPGYEDINKVITDFQEDYVQGEIGKTSKKDNTDLVYQFGTGATTDPVFKYVKSS